MQQQLHGLSGLSSHNSSKVQVLTDFLLQCRVQRLILQQHNRKIVLVQLAGLVWLL